MRIGEGGGGGTRDWKMIAHFSVVAATTFENDRWSSLLGKAIDDIGLEKACKCNGNTFSEEKHIIGGNSSLSATIGVVNFTTIFLSTFCTEHEAYRGS